MRRIIPERAYSLYCRLSPVTDDGDLTCVWSPFSYNPFPRAPRHGSHEVELVVEELYGSFPIRLSIENLKSPL